MRQPFEEGVRLFAQDKAAALARLEEAAALGNPLAMVEAAKCYWHGIGSEADREKAARLLGDARDAGSWHATISLTRDSSRRGDMERCTAILEEGVRADYTAAMFWLAWYRYREKPSRRTARAILPLFETALERGHPGARCLMARLLIRGRPGLARIGEGWYELMSLDHELKQGMKYAEGEPAA